MKERILRTLQQECTSVPAVLSAQRSAAWNFSFGPGTTSLGDAVTQPLPHMRSAHAITVQSALTVGIVFGHAFVISYCHTVWLYHGVVLEHINRLSLVRNKIKLLLHIENTSNGVPASTLSPFPRKLCRAGICAERAEAGARPAPCLQWLFHHSIYTLYEQGPSGSTLAGPRNCLCLWRRAGIAAPSPFLVGTAAATTAGSCHCWLCILLTGAAGTVFAIAGLYSVLPATVWWIWSPGSHQSSYLPTCSFCTCVGRTTGHCGC